MFEWTLEHHKKFVDTFIFLGGDEETVGVHSALKAELLSLAECSCRSFYLDFHLSLLGVLQKTSQALFSSETVTLDSLYVAPTKMSSPWTLEHHRRVVEAVIHLGGLGSRKTTPKAVLELMDEEDRRQGVTAKMIRRHLIGLYHLQKETQRLLDFGLAGGEEERELSLRELQFLIRKGVPLQRHLEILKTRVQMIKFDRQVLKAFA